MSESTAKLHEGPAAEMVDGLRNEFLSDLLDNLQAADKELAAARKGRGDTGALAGRLRQIAFETKGQSHNFDLPLVNTIAHRMEDYLAAAPTLAPAALDDVQQFVDLLCDVLNGDVGTDGDPSVLVRDLPARPAAEAQIVETRETEILLVMLHGAATKKVQRELQECGYRVNIVTSTFDALPLIMRTKPDLVVVSAVMAELSGIDLAIALKAMPVTRNTPVALITSFGRDHNDLAYLPAGVPIIQKGATFSDDIAVALDYHFLI